MVKWATELVADRFSEAAQTAERLPPVRVQGYFNCWPDIQRMAWERLGADHRCIASHSSRLQSIACTKPCVGCSGWKRSSAI